MKAEAELRHERLSLLVEEVRWRHLRMVVPRGRLICHHLPAFAGEWDVLGVPSGTAGLRPDVRRISVKLGRAAMPKIQCFNFIDLLRALPLHRLSLQLRASEPRGVNWVVAHVLPAPDHKHASFARCHEVRRKPKLLHVDWQPPRVIDVGTGIPSNAGLQGFASSVLGGSWPAEKMDSLQFWPMPTLGRECSMACTEKSERRISGECGMACIEKSEHRVSRECAIA